MRNNLTRLEIIHALVALDAECEKQGIAGEICIYGGAGMVLVFDARQSTRDVDAVFRPKAEIRTAAEAVASRLGLPLDWLNDGVKGFLSETEETRRISIPELEALQNLRIVWPTPEYLLAMKCMAARSDDSSTDKEDVVFLFRRVGIRSEEQALEIVERFFPKERIHIKTHYFISENLELLKQSEGSEP
jgi:hypothetical protein